MTVIASEAKQSRKLRLLKKNVYTKIATVSEIVRIEDEFYAPPYENQISERHYFYANGMMRTLDAVRALGEEGLTHGLKLAPIPDSELSAAVCGSIAASLPEVERHAKSYSRRPTEVVA